VSNPYIDLHIWKNLRIRSFFNPNESELIWHRDKKDRLCVVLHGSAWKFQLDNELPIELSVGDSFVVPRQVYHRIIKGDSTLVLLIKEFEHESIDESHQFHNEVHN
jgi:quercetin dioxygenase-like cupin family protein